MEASRGMRTRSGIDLATECYTHSKTQEMVSIELLPRVRTTSSQMCLRVGTSAPQYLLLSTKDQYEHEDLSSLFL
jgi:hypothetical protein